MPNAIALGSGPVAFTTSAGKFLLIPLSAISFKDDGSIELSGDYSNENELQNWLKYLVQIGSIKPGAKSPPKPALKISAVDPGAAGNNIQVEFKLNVINADNIDATVTEQAIYTLSCDSKKPNYIGTVLAADQGNLVHVTGSIQQLPPPTGTYNFSGGDIGTAKTDVKETSVNGTTYFTLEARKKGEAGDLITVDISNVNTANQTFELVAKWTKTVQNLSVENLSQLNDEAGYVIKVNSIDGNTAIPAPGIIKLGGGADKQEAKQASAIAFTS